MASNERDANAFPELTIDVGASPRRSTGGAAPAGSSIGQRVELELREVLAWRPKSSDVKGFNAALRQAFSVREVEGRTEWSWQPHSYTVQADMGAVTGAQASIYARARAALDQSIPLLDAIYPLRADADDQDAEATRAVVRQQLHELVSELGTVGGPRLQRVNAIFAGLLGARFIRDRLTDPEQVEGLLGVMRERFGLDRLRVNTIEEEKNLTDFFILVDHTIGLERSWESQARFFNPESNDKFLGTELVLLARVLNVIAESVQELYFILDSVWLGDSERQTIPISFLDANGRRASLTIAELLTWVERFTLEEAPRLVREAGKDGVIAIRPTIDTLVQLVTSARDLASQQSSNPTPGFHTARTRTAFNELRAHLLTAKRHADRIKRTPLPQVAALAPREAQVGATRELLLVFGQHFDPQATVFLARPQGGGPLSPGIDLITLIDEGRVERITPIAADGVTVVGTTQASAFFDLSAASPGEWSVVVENPDHSIAALEDGFLIRPGQALPPPQPVIRLVEPRLLDPLRDQELTIEGDNLPADSLITLRNDQQALFARPVFVNATRLTARFDLSRLSGGERFLVELTGASGTAGGGEVQVDLIPSPGGLLGGLNP